LLALSWQTMGHVGVPVHDTSLMMMMMMTTQIGNLKPKRKQWLFR